MKKKIIITIGIVSLLGVGAWYVKSIITDKIYSKLSEVIATPEVQKEIEAAVNSELAAKIAQDPSLTVPADVQNLTKDLQQQTGSTDPQQEKKTSPAAVNSDEKSTQDAKATPSVDSNQNTENAPAIKNRSEAVQYATKKFSASEIAHYSSVYKNRNNLTPEQKQQLKSEVLSKFTAEELKALLAASNR